MDRNTVEVINAGRRELRGCRRCSLIEVDGDAGEIDSARGPSRFLVPIMPGHPSSGDGRERSALGGAGVDTGASAQRLTSAMDVTVPRDRR